MGLESLCARELAAIPLDISPVKPETGGVEFDGRLSDCYRVNLACKTANRVLMRISDFTATNFRQLDKIVERFPWELYIKPGATLRFEVSTRHSRLTHKKAVSEHFQAGLDRRLKPFSGAGAGEGRRSDAQRVFIRVVDDRFTVSLDSSGSLLYRRGIKSHPATAPIRETIAAAVLQWAGYEPGMPLVDPMCGAGTFSLEAAIRAHRIPAGWYRGFAFFDWPAFRPRQWAYIRKQFRKRIEWQHRLSIYASDKDPQACRYLNETVASVGFDGVMSVENRDFFKWAPASIMTGVGLVVLNPPYGRRMANREAGLSLFRRICHKMEADYSGWRFGMVVPYKKWLPNLHFRYHLHPVRHGGRQVYVVTGKID